MIRANRINLMRSEDIFHQGLIQKSSLHKNIAQRSPYLGHNIVRRRTVVQLVKVYKSSEKTLEFFF